ncbi:MAG: 50S ribosomal protein L35ae [Zestosphaera sp.]
MGSRIPVELGVGVLVGYRVGSRGQNSSQVFVKILTTILKKPHNLVGAKILAKDAKGNTYTGRVIKVHGSGRNGTLIVRFNKNIPGQLLGVKVSIYRTRSG